MKRQSKPWFCGVASVSNALEVLGIKRSQREVARLCNVTEDDGTDETEMKRALLASGVQVDEWSDTVEAASITWLIECVKNGRPVIACVDNDAHWVTVIGACGDRLLLFDPSRNFGVEVCSWPALTLRWVNEDGIYYGLAVSSGK